MIYLPNLAITPIGRLIEGIVMGITLFLVVKINLDLKKIIKK